MLKRIILALITTVVAVHHINANEISTAVDYKPQPFDVLEYKINAEIANPSAKHIVGNCEMLVRLAKTDQEEIFYFHLFDLNIDSCKVGDQLVTPGVGTDAQGVSYYSIPTEQFTESEIVVNVYYSGIMGDEGGQMSWGGIHWQDNALFNMGVGFNNANVSAAAYWFPCYDHPSDKALYKITLTVPKDYSVALSGEESSDELIADDMRRVSVNGKVPAATYMIGMAVGKFEKLSIEGTQVPNVIYSPASKVKDCQSGLRLLPQMIECYEKYWGEYPFEKVGYVITAIGSMEHQGMIALSKNVVFSYDSISSTAAHELSHSWFGGSLTPMDFRSAWLNEAFATYSEAIWAGYVLGDYRYYRKIVGFAEQYQSSSAEEGVFPLHDFVRTGTSSNYPMTIYYKGASVVHQLRYELGDSLFFGAINKYIADHSNSIVNTELFKHSIEQYTGKDLTEFFDMWIYGSGYPIINSKIEQYPYPDGNYVKCKVITSQVQDAGWGVYKNVPFEINFKLADKTYDTRIVNINETEQSVILDSIPAYTAIEYNSGRASASLIKLKSKSVNNVNTAQISEKLISVVSNPVSSNNLTLKINSPVNQIITILISDMSGKVYAKYENIDFTAISEYNIDVSNLSNGSYLIIVDDENNNTENHSLRIAR